MLTFFALNKSEINQFHSHSPIIEIGIIAFYREKESFLSYHSFCDEFTSHNKPRMLTRAIDI